LRISLIAKGQYFDAEALDSVHFLVDIECRAHLDDAFDRGFIQDRPQVRLPGCPCIADRSKSIDQSLEPNRSNPPDVLKTNPISSIRRRHRKHPEH
jgi:hypothetical protein